MTKKYQWPVGSGSDASPIGPWENGVNEGTPEAHLERGEQWAIDIPAPAGTPIYASHGGRVVEVVHDPDSSAAGRYIDLVWDDGQGRQHRTRDCHCGTLIPGLGDTVNRGDQIATVGSTGFSTGPHDHHVRWVDGVRVKPDEELDEEEEEPAQQEADTGMLTGQEIANAQNALNVLWGVGNDLLGTPETTHSGRRTRAEKSLGNQAQDAVTALKSMLVARGLPG